MQNSQPGRISSDLSDRFFEAIISSDLEELTRLFESGANANMTDGQGRSALRYAIGNNDCPLTQLLFEHQADMTRTDEFGRGPLHWGAIGDALETIQFLLGLSLDLELKDRSGRTALWYAVSSGSLEVVQLFLAEYADPQVRDMTGESLIHFAAENSSCEIVDQLIKAGADFTEPGLAGSTLLHDAVRNKDLLMAQATAELLMNKYSLDPLVKDAYGASALDTAARQGTIPLIRFFLDRSVKPDFNTVRSAIASDSSDLVLLLFERGVDPHLLELGTNRSFLHYAVKYGSPKLIRSVASLGINRNVQDCYGETALFYALSRRDYRTVFWLLDNGADPSLANEDGHTILHLAAKDGNLRLVRHLIEQRNMNPEHRDSDSRTPADLAVQYCNLDLILYFGREPLQEEAPIDFDDFSTDFSASK